MRTPDLEARDQYRNDDRHVLNGVPHSLKRNELIAAMAGASNRLIDVEMRHDLLNRQV